MEQKSFGRKVFGGLGTMLVGIGIWIAHSADDAARVAYHALPESGAVKEEIKEIAPKVLKKITGKAAKEGAKQGYEKGKEFYKDYKEFKEYKERKSKQPTIGTFPQAQSFPSAEAIDRALHPEKYKVDPISSKQKLAPLTKEQEKIQKKYELGSKSLDQLLEPSSKGGK